MQKYQFLLFITLTQSLSLRASINVVGPSSETKLQDQVCKLMFTSDEEEAICTGVRIDETTILSAEHCARNVETGVLNNLPEIVCEGRSLEAISMTESNQYFHFLDKGIQAFFRAGVDFSQIKVKKEKQPFLPKFKIHENFESFSNDFLTTSDQYNYEFRKPTICEVHGYGMDEFDRVGTLNSSQLSSSPTFMNQVFKINITPLGNDGFNLKSPLLPMKATNWIYTYVRPGDSGGPLFCLNEKNEWVLAGIASTLQTGECPKEINELLDKKSKMKCAQNSWGVPTKETLNNLLQK
jgi:hypothetical protein